MPSFLIQPTNHCEPIRLSFPDRPLIAEGWRSPTGTFIRAHKISAAWLPKSSRRAAQPTSRLPPAVEPFRSVYPKNSPMLDERIHAIDCCLRRSDSRSRVWTTRNWLRMWVCVGGKSSQKGSRFDLVGCWSTNWEKFSTRDVILIESEARKLNR